MSFAALKRKLTVGTQLELIAGPPWFSHKRPMPYPRTIAKVQSNGLWFEPDEYTKGKRSWIEWPSARLVEATDDGFSIKDSSGDDAYTLTYRFA